MNQTRLIPRVLQEKVIQAPQDKALVLFGARQTGKTTLLRQMFDTPRTRWFSGDEVADVALLTGLTSRADLQVLLSGLDVMVIDEAQRVPGIGLLLKRIVDAQTGCRVVATGSSSLELAGGVMESAAGRLWQEYIWPISVQELAREQSWIDVVSNLPMHLVYGLYPYVVREPRFAMKTLQDLTASVLFKDIFALSGIRRHDKFEHLVKLLAYNIGSLVSCDALARETGLSALTVAHYITLLEQSFIIKSLSSYSQNLGNELKKSKKIYFCDLGIRNAVLGNFQPYSARNDAERGALWENFFVMERVKMRSYDESGAQLFFWRNKEKNEVDLIELMPNGSMNAFECKVKDEKATAPAAFLRLYPDCVFHVATLQNFYRYFVSPNVSAGR
jgi:hypothetical protein